MAIHLSEGTKDRAISQQDKENYLQALIDKIGKDAKRILLLPPDFTRFHSDAGNLCAILYQKLKDQAHIDLMPALGTHVPMAESQIRKMFGPDIPLDRFLPHDWRNGIKELGEVPASKIKELSHGAVEYPMQVAVNRQLFEGNYDLIISLGQVVPHEVIGMANYTKNICVGVGGSDMINKSHFLGAVYGMEKILGRSNTPVRQVLNYSFDNFIAHLPIHFVLTVTEVVDEKLCMRGLYAGNDHEVFEEAAKLSQQVNLDLLDQPIKKAVVYLDPEEFMSTWLGNKSIYRLRMAMADQGELIVLAPALKEFGEDKEIDRLIRKYGYKGTPNTLKAVKENQDLQNNLSAAAHLIHGSSEGRFNITYCPGPNVSQQEIESVGFNYCSYETMISKYNPKALNDGYNEVNGEQIFYVSNPALGLWALKEHFPN